MKGMKSMPQQILMILSMFLIFDIVHVNYFCTVLFVVVFQFGGEMFCRPGVVSALLYRTPTKRTLSPWPGTTSLKCQRTTSSPLQARPNIFMITVNFWQIAFFFSVENKFDLDFELNNLKCLKFSMHIIKKNVESQNMLQSIT